MVALVELLEVEEDSLGYTTYVFKCLEDDFIKITPYLMLTRWPNWEHRKLDKGEIGYVEFEEIIAGVNKWFDGERMIPYNYSTVQFIKFIKKTEKDDHKYIM